jgi:integrase
MGIAMVALTRNNSGQWTARKAIPADVRTAYGKREEKKTWPAALSQGQAKAEFAAWLTAIEDRIGMLRAMAGQAPVTLSKRQSRALAGDWYKAKVAQHEDDPGRAVDWWFSREELEPDDPEEREAGRIRPTAWLMTERDALLQARGLKLTDGSGDELLQEMGDLWLSLCDLMERRAQGDYGKDPLVDTLPDLEAAPRKPSVAVSITQLFEDYAATGQLAPRTVIKWRGVIASFVGHVGHDDATKVSREDAHSWFAALIAGGRSSRTVRMTHRAALSRVFKVAVDRKQLPATPFDRLEVYGPKGTQTRRKDISDAEAATILKAALGEQPERRSPTHALARRWVPWICAYTGARVNEVTQMRAMDIRKVDGVWVFHITPEAGPVKTAKARSVPIHSHLIAQGITALAKAGDKTPLFYDPSGVRKESSSYPLSAQIGSKLAKWVRSLGVTEVESPNHGWRHRFKSQGRGAGIPEGVLSVLQGHALKTEGERYGHWPMDALRAEVEKLERYSVG